MKKQPQRTETTRRRIMDAFWSLYQEKGIERISIKEIVQRAGYNRSTFYEYYIDIYDVLEQLEDQLIPAFSQLPPSSSRQMDGAIEAILSLYEQNSVYYSVLLGENGDPAFLEKLKSSIKRVVRNTVLRPSQLTELEFDFLLEREISGLIGVIRLWFKLGKPISAEKLINLMYQEFNFSHNRDWSKE